MLNNLLALYELQLTTSEARLISKRVPNNMLFGTLSEVSRASDAAKLELIFMSMPVEQLLLLQRCCVVVSWSVVVSCVCLECHSPYTGWLSSLWTSFNLPLSLYSPLRSSSLSRYCVICHWCRLVFVILILVIVLVVVDVVVLDIVVVVATSNGKTKFQTPAFFGDVSMLAWKHSAAFTTLLDWSCNCSSISPR